MKILAMVAVVAATGCSFFLVSGPARPDDTSCTEGYESPVIDAVLSAGGVALTVGAAIGASHETSPDSLDVGGTFVTIGALVAVPYLISSLVGFTSVAECRDARREAKARNPSRSRPGATLPIR